MQQSLVSHVQAKAHCWNWMSSCMLCGLTYYKHRVFAMSLLFLDNDLCKLLFHGMALAVMVCNVQGRPP